MVLGGQEQGGQVDVDAGVGVVGEGGGSLRLVFLLVAAVVLDFGIFPS